MKPFSKIVLIALGFGLLTIALSSIPNYPAAAQDQTPPLSPVLVRDVDNPVRHEFKQFIVLSPTNLFQKITVPAGKRIVIEYVAGRACVSAGLVPELVLAESDPISGAALASYRLASAGSINGIGGLNCFAFNQMMRAYVDEGSVLSVAFGGTPASSMGLEITISGYQLDVP